MRTRNRITRSLAMVGTLLVVAGSAIAAQQTPPSVTVTGDIPQALTLTSAGLAAMPRATVTTTSNGIATTYEGVWLADVLKKAGAPLGAMRGPALSTYVLASASDGYQVLFSFAELDPDMTVSVARLGRLVPIVALAALLGASAREAEYVWDIPAPFPKPPVPADNPMSAVKVELGRRLFYDNRMSVTGGRSCASCHQQAHGFTDGRDRSEGATGELHPRGSMSLANVAYLPALTWADSTVTTLEDQALIPMFGTDPIELGLEGREAQFLGQLRGDTLYQRLFPSSFPGASDPFTIRNVVRAIASFERTIISVRSPYDRYRYGSDTNAISESAKRGERFFVSGQRGSCFQCHGGWNFSGSVRFDGDTSARAAFFNTGLYNVAGRYSYPPPNTGLHRVSGRDEDVGKFRPPTLRNIAVTAPYMHDGSIATLAEVLDHYAAGGRTINDGPLAGVGRENRNKAPNVHGFAITDAERRDVIAFLESLTDTAFLRNPALSNPWK